MGFISADLGYDPDTRVLTVPFKGDAAALETCLRAAFNLPKPVVADRQTQIAPGGDGDAADVPRAAGGAPQAETGENASRQASVTSATPNAAQDADTPARTPQVNAAAPQVAAPATAPAQAQANPANQAPGINTLVRADEQSAPRAFDELSNVQQKISIYENIGKTNTG